MVQATLVEIGIIGYAGFILCLGIIYDWKTQRIPDVLSLLLGIGGLVFSGLLHGFFGVLTNILLFLVFFGIGILLFQIGFWGGGDVKIAATLLAYGSVFLEGNYTLGITEYLVEVIQLTVISLQNLMIGLILYITIFGLVLLGKKVYENQVPFFEVFSKTDLGMVVVICLGIETSVWLVQGNLFWGLILGCGIASTILLITHWTMFMDLLWVNTSIDNIGLGDRINTPIQLSSGESIPHGRFLSQKELDLLRSDISLQKNQFLVWKGFPLLPALIVPFLGLFLVGDWIQVLVNILIN